MVWGIALTVAVYKADHKVAAKEVRTVAPWALEVMALVWSLAYEQPKLSIQGLKEGKPPRFTTVGACRCRCGRRVHMYVHVVMHEEALGGLGVPVPGSRWLAPRVCNSYSA